MIQFGSYVYSLINSKAGMWKHENKDEEIGQKKIEYKSSLIASIQFTKSMQIKLS